MPYGNQTEDSEEGLPLSDKLKNLAILSLSLAPGAAFESKIGKALGAGAMGGLVGSSVGQAAEPAQQMPTESQGSAAAGDVSGVDPLIGNWTNELRSVTQEIAEQDNGVKNPSGGWIKPPGRGPKYNQALERKSKLEKDITARQMQLDANARNPTPEQTLRMEAAKDARRDREQKRSDEVADRNRNTAMNFGGVGALAGAGLTSLAAYLTHGRSKKFNDVANRLGTHTDTARMSRYSDMGLADDVAAGVDEAASLRGQPKPFGLEPDKYAGLNSAEGISAQQGGTAGGPFARAGKPSAESEATARAVTGSRGGSTGDLGDTFEKPMSFGAGEYTMPAAGLADFGIMQGKAYFEPDQAKRESFDNLSYQGLGFAAGSKLGRLVTKPLSTGFSKLEAGSATKVDAARNKLMREVGETRPAPVGDPKRPTPGGGGQPQKPSQPRGHQLSSGARGLLPKDLHAAKARTAQSRASFVGNPSHGGMQTALAQLSREGKRATADSVMTKLRQTYPGGRIDGVKINRKEIGNWLRTHGHLP